MIKAVGQMKWKVIKAVDSLNYCRNIKAGSSLIKAVGRMKLLKRLVVQLDGINTFIIRCTFAIRPWVGQHQWTMDPELEAFITQAMLEV